MTYQLVKAPTDDAEILLDLDNGLPFEVIEGTQSSPASMRYATTSSMLRDGELVSGSSWSGRTLNLKLNVRDRLSAERQARAVQTLAQILNQRSSWLKWHNDGHARPVFFRLERSSFAVLDEWLTKNPRRQLSLDIPCDPFVYGEKVEGTFDIANDTFVHEWTDVVQGDVATPLCLSFTHPATLKEFTTLAASVARRDFSQAAAFKQSLAASGAPTASSGWAVADTSDTTAIAGTRRRLTRAVAGTRSFQRATPDLHTWPDLPPGDYRVVVRARLIAGTDVGLVFTGGPNGVAGHTPPVASLTIRNAPSTGAGWDWYDLGVVSLPAGNPKPDDIFGAAPDEPVDTYWTLDVYSATVTTIDLDEPMLIPVGGSNIAMARCSMSRAPATTVPKDVVLDGVTDRRWFNQNGLLGAFSAIAGELPHLVPGAYNTLHLMLAEAVNAAGTYTGYADVKTVVTTVNYSYFPRYVGGFRPAAT